MRTSLTLTPCCRCSRSPNLTPITRADNCSSAPMVIFISEWATADQAAILKTALKILANFWEDPAFDVNGGSPIRFRPVTFVGTAGAKPEIWPWASVTRGDSASTGSPAICFIGTLDKCREEVNLHSRQAVEERTTLAEMEGLLVSIRAQIVNDGTLTLPILEYTHSSGDCTVIGGYRYRAHNDRTGGTYIYGDFCTGRIWGATPSGAICRAFPCSTCHSISTSEKIKEANSTLHSMARRVRSLALRVSPRRRPTYGKWRQHADHGGGGQRDHRGRANLAPNDSNIVALFATGTANSQSLSWVYLTGNQSTPSGTLTGLTTSFVLPATGPFEVRALYWVSGDRVCARRHEP